MPLDWIKQVSVAWGWGDLATKLGIGAILGFVVASAFFCKSGSPRVLTRLDTVYVESAKPKHVVVTKQDTVRLLVSVKDQVDSGKTAEVALTFLTGEIPLGTAFEMSKLIGISLRSSETDTLTAIPNATPPFIPGLLWGGKIDFAASYPVGFSLGFKLFLSYDKWEIWLGPGLTYLDKLILRLWAGSSVKIF